MGISQAGMLQAGITPSSDTVTRTTLGNIESDNRPWSAVSGTWAASGSALTTTTARGSDPRVIVMEPYSDFDISATVGYGDAVYLRYKDANNWLRVTQHMQYSTSDYACNPYNCNPRNCNCTSCNAYACNRYIAYYQNCNGYSCITGYNCSPQNCNCVTNYTARNNYASSITCLHVQFSGFAGYNNCSSCRYCCSPSSCPATTYQSGSSYCTNSGTCYEYLSYTCQTCYSPCYGTCYEQCPVYAWETCYQTCCDTCYDTCYETCTNYYYPVYLRVEKMVNGALSLVEQLSLGESARVTTLRITGKADAISIYSDRSPSTAHASYTISEGASNVGFGVGRHGYGNQDSGDTLDNITIKPFGQT